MALPPAAAAVLLHLALVVVVVVVVVVAVAKSAQRIQKATEALRPNRYMETLYSVP